MLKNILHNVSNISDRNEATNISVHDINNLCVTGYYNAQHKLNKSMEIYPEKNNNMEWDTGMVLITGDSLLSGLQERKMGPKVKVRSFPGARIKDYYSYLLPLVEKHPCNIILMAGTNDSIEESM